MVMDFPATPPSEIEPPAGLLEQLGIEVSYFGRSVFDYLLVLTSERAVRDLTAAPFAALDLDIRGFIATARATEAQYDFVSRFFAPGAGVPEDPVTGSAHCCLGPYWQRVLGKDTLLAYQASARGGEVGVKLSGDRVLLEGQAVTVMRGELLG